MYLHIGEDRVVFIRDIIAIMDIEKTTISKNTREYLKKCEEKGIIEAVGADIPKSFIVTMKNTGEEKVFLSPISSSTLGKRIFKQADDSRRNYIDG